MASDAASVEGVFDLLEQGGKIPRGKVSEALRTLGFTPYQEEVQELATGDMDLAAFTQAVGKAVRAQVYRNIGPYTFLQTSTSLEDAEDAFAVFTPDNGVGAHFCTYPMI